MKKKSAYSFIKAHNLINRIYDMFNYLNLIHINTRDIVLNELKNSLHDIYYIETLAKYFEDVKNKNKKAPPAGQNILHPAGGAFGCCK